ncbi:uncharacterized protein [Watersipora subatra]|uniref:uncharacterized protein n=1 Tax=Watersipora subatra TaxID=2589382 RepID=UPI00355B2C56
MFCAEGVLRKAASRFLTSFTNYCSLFIEEDEVGWQTLKFYWDLTVLHDQCGPDPVCKSMSSTFDSAIFVSSSHEMLHEESIRVIYAENRTKDTIARFFPVDTYHYFIFDNSAGDGPCLNRTLEITTNYPWVTCGAPAELAIIPDDTDPTEMHTNYFLFNYGVWSAQPPECVIKKCTDIDLEALGFTSNNVITPIFDYYLVGEQVEISCADGLSQINYKVSAEVITCVADATLGTIWMRAEDSLRITDCKVRRCSRPYATTFGLEAGSLQFDRSEDSYNLGESVTMRCSPSYVQVAPNVREEEIRCVSLINGQGDVKYEFVRAERELRLKPCLKIGCQVPIAPTYKFLHIRVNSDGRLEPSSKNPFKDIGMLGFILCNNLRWGYKTECTRPENGSLIGIWVPTPHCEPKNCSNFMGDSTLYEYELQYGRHIIGEPRFIRYLGKLTFVCPAGSIGYQRNQLTYQCRVGPDGYGHFEPLKEGVYPDCRPMGCSRNDRRTGYQLEINIPFKERACYGNGTCKKGMLATLHCSDSTDVYIHYYQCDIPSGSASVAMNQSDLDAALHAGVWFPTPSCDKGCGPPVNISEYIDCVSKGRNYDQGNWNFPNRFVVNCTCNRGLMREDGSPPQVQCDATEKEWKVIKPCRVDCGPLPDLNNTRHNVTYYEAYALMELECEEGYRFFPYRYEKTRTVIVECQRFSGWLNLHLFECKALDGCTEDALQELHPGIYLTPYRDYYDNHEAVVARCTRGYLAGDHQIPLSYSPRPDNGISDEGKKKWQCWLLKK